MELSVIGVSHSTAPISIREKCAFTDSDIIERTAQLLDRGISEAVILSTCNRSEVYYVSNTPQESASYAQILSSLCFPAESSSYIYFHTEREAITHLYSVAAGLQSAVLGEDQILNQLKIAFEFSSQLGATGKVSSYLFRQAVTVAKKIKSELRISELPLSTIHIGVNLLEREMGSLSGKRIMLVGMGKINTLALKYLSGQNIFLLLCARNTEAALAAAQACNADCTVIPFADRYEYLPQTDAVISATSAPHTVFMTDKLANLNHPLTFLDMAVPRDVETTAATLPMVSLFNIDDLKRVSDDSLRSRQLLSLEAHDMIDSAAAEAMDWLRLTITDSSICSLNERCRQITGDSMEIIERKLQLSQRDSELIRKVIASGLRRILREPIQTLKSTEDQQDLEYYVATLRKLFQLQ